MAAPNTDRLLLFEDDYAMQSVLRTLLEIEGFQVITGASRANETGIFDQIRSEQPGLILLDVFLGGANGIDIVRRVRAASDIIQPRIIMSSGMDLGDECISAGADDFVLKPFMPHELIQKLRG